MSQQQTSHPPPGTAPAPGVNNNMNNAQMFPPSHQVAQQMMAYTNQALAANPLFQPQAMSNVGPFMALPEMFTQQGVAAAHQAVQQVAQQQPVAQRNDNTAQAQQVGITQAGMMMPGMAAVMGNQAAASGFNVVPPDATQNGRMNTSPAQPQQTLTPAPATQSIAPSQEQASLAPVPTAPISAPNMGLPQQPALGGVPIPVLPPQSSTAMQMQVAAAASAAAAAPLSTGGNNSGDKPADGERKKTKDLSAEEKAQLNRDRNREHARSTRLRKKAYVQKLKELVDGLHVERTEEVRKRRVAIQHLAEVQSVRRAVVRTFLRFHSNYECDPRKWTTILEDTFWFKQPVTPYRTFRRVEIEQECRMSRGVDAMIADAASQSVMVENIGSRSPRWMQIKRRAVYREKSKSGNLPNSIVREDSRLQHAVSSLSSSSGSSNGSGSEEDRQQAGRQKVDNFQKGLTNIPGDKATAQQPGVLGVGGTAPKVSSSSNSSSDSQSKQKQSNDFHDYHAPSLPDPMFDSGGSTPDSDSPADSNNNDNGLSGTKRISTDSSSGDEDKIVEAAKRRKVSSSQHCPGSNENATGVQQRVLGSGEVKVPASTVTAARPVEPLRSGLPANIAKSGGISHNIQIPANIAKSGGISHNIQPVIGGGGLGNATNPRLAAAPAMPIPPFLGIGKRTPLPTPAATTTVAVGAALINTTNPPPATTTSVAVDNTAPPNTQTTLGSAAISLSRDSSQSNGVGGGTAAAVTAPTAKSDNETSSSNSSSQSPQIQAYYHVNEDDMLLTDDVLMCPYVFRSQDAVLCGALSECIMPGMLRAHFSPRNKLLSLEMVYDAMGFMQQLERASGSEGTAQIVPSSLDMALSPNTNEARVITEAKPPFLIVSVNEAWTRTTKYTQMEVEGKQLSILNGKLTAKEAAVRPGKPVHKFEEVARGKCACSTNIHYDKHGKEFVDVVCSYPLTNSDDEITFILHVFKELPESTSPTHDLLDSSTNGISNEVTNEKEMQEILQVQA